MNFVQCRRLLTLATLITYCAVLNGQSTTDDNNTNEVDDLRAELANLANSVARIAELKGLLAAAVNEIAKLKNDLAEVAAKKPDDCKLSILIFVHFLQVVTFLMYTM